MSTQQENKEQGKATLAYFESITSLVSDFIESQEQKEANTNVILKNLSDLQKEAVLAELEKIKVRISRALPGEQKRLIRKLSIQKGDVEASTHFILSEQERLEKELQNHYLHRSYMSLGVHALTPNEMWEHYKTLKLGDIQAVYDYQLKRELHYFLESKLDALDNLNLPPKTDMPINGMLGVAQQTNPVVLENVPVIPAPGANKSRSVELPKAKSKAGRPKNVIDKTFSGLFKKEGEGERILNLLRHNNYINNVDKWLGKKSGLAALKWVLWDASSFEAQEEKIVIIKAFKKHFGLEPSNELFYTKPKTDNILKVYDDLKGLIYSK